MIHHEALVARVLNINDVTKIEVECANFLIKQDHTIANLSLFAKSVMQI